MRLPILLIGILILGQSQAQNLPPKNYNNGAIVLIDKTRIIGFIKNNMHRTASISFISSAEGSKKEYFGTSLVSVEIENEKFICIQGDFFKIISEGGLEFLQKQSDASNIPSYNGTDAVFSNGTQGKRGDYFIYEKNKNQLELVSKKNIKDLATFFFNNYAPALASAEKAYSDIPKLKDAIEIYNQRLNNSN